MTKYLILESEGSAGLIEAEHLSAHERLDDPDDPSKVVKEFEAVCSCAAAQVFAEHQGHEPYDMYFCKQDAEDEDPNLCPHFTKQLAKLEELSRDRG